MSTMTCVTYFFSQKSRIKVVKVSCTRLRPSAVATAEFDKDDDDGESADSVPRIIRN